MNLADIAILCFILLTTIIGFYCGLANIVLTLVAWLSASFLSLELIPIYAPLLMPYLNNVVLTQLAVFIAVLIFSLIVINLISYLITRLVNYPSLTVLNKALGLFFGMLLSITIVATSIFFTPKFTALPQQSWWQESVLVEFFEHINDRIRIFLPAAQQHKGSGG